MPACSETLFGSLRVERLQGQRFETRHHPMDAIIGTDSGGKVSIESRGQSLKSQVANLVRVVGVFKLESPQELAAA